MVNMATFLYLGLLSYNGCTKHCQCMRFVLQYAVLMLAARVLSTAGSGYWQSLIDNAMHPLSREP